MKKILFLLTAFLPIRIVAEDFQETNIATFQEVVYALSTDVELGEIKQISIQMNNPNTRVKGFQFDMYLPDDLEFVISDETTPQLSTQRTTLSATDFFGYAIQSNGALRILCYSTNQLSISGTSGEICTIPVKLKEDTRSKSYPVKLKRIIYTDGARYSISEDIISSILAYKAGDVNGDSNIDVADIIRLSSYINGTPAGPVITQAADINHNQTIDAEDARMIFSLILQSSEKIKQ